MQIVGDNLLEMSDWKKKKKKKLNPSIADFRGSKTGS